MVEVGFRRVGPYANLGHYSIIAKSDTAVNQHGPFVAGSELVRDLSGCGDSVPDKAVWHFGLGFEPWSIRPTQKTRHVD